MRAGYKLLKIYKVKSSKLSQHAIKDSLMADETINERFSIDEIGYEI